MMIRRCVSTVTTPMTVEQFVNAVESICNASWLDESVESKVTTGTVMVVDATVCH